MIHDRYKTGRTWRLPRKADAEKGQALLELTLVTPLLFLLMILAVNFGAWLNAWTQIGNAARAVANYAALGTSSVGTPGVSPAAIISLVDQDLSTLPNYSSTTNPTVIVCWNSNGTVSPIFLGTTCSSPPGDPEPSSYIAVSVDLTYTFTPVFASFNFNNLGIHLPTMLTSIHRRIVMRHL